VTQSLQGVNSLILFLLFATGVVDTGGKFTASINDTSVTGGKFTIGVIDTGGAP
jgi:hypothetical protein